MQNRGFPKAFTNNSNEKSHLGFLVLPFWQQQLFCRLVIFLSFHFQRLYDIPRQREDTNPNRWFSITWWDDRVGAQHNREWWLMVCIIIESDSHTSFFLICPVHQLEGDDVGWKPPIESIDTVAIRNEATLPSLPPYFARFFALGPCTE